VFFFFDTILTAVLGEPRLKLLKQ